MELFFLNARQKFSGRWYVNNKPLNKRQRHQLLKGHFFLREKRRLTIYCRDIVLLTVGVYSSNHRVLYNIGISMTRRFKKSVGPSVRLSVSVCLCVRLSVCNTNKKAYSSFIIDSRKINRILGERAYHPLQENEELYSNVCVCVCASMRAYTLLDYNS